MSKTVIVRGSWGELKVHRATGVVLAYDDEGREGWDADDVGYHDIRQFDPAAFAMWPDDDQFDILNTAFFDEKGIYTPRLAYVTEWYVYGDERSRMSMHGGDLKYLEYHP